MPDYQILFNQIKGSLLDPLTQCLPDLVAQQFDASRWGELSDWLGCLNELPKIATDFIELKDCVRIGARDQLTTSEERLREILMVLHPWRKGPFELFGLKIDSEWRSDFKWERLLPYIQPLDGRSVLDVGCGNGYHCWRMLGAGASRVIGIDPSVKFVCQFYALKSFIDANIPVDVLPLASQQMPQSLNVFDTVFSMGVLYHRKSPIHHLIELRNMLRPGGQLVLETLIINKDEGFSLIPDGRYAQMKNVWFIPSPDTLLVWLTKTGFQNPRVVDLCVTTTKEQRSTEWMNYHSLKDFLHPDGSGNTIEGHPAPTRGLFTAELPF